MAFQITNPNQQWWLPPQTVDGCYLLPYSWLKYGLDNQLLEIESKAFYDTVQGSLYLQLEDENITPHFTTKDGKYRDVWYCFFPGKDVASPILTDTRTDEGYSLLKGSYLKQDVHFVNLGDLMNMSPSQQKTVNNSIIQLMKGCNVKLKFSVWF